MKTYKILTIALLTAASAAMAQTSGTLLLQGAVSPSVSITVAGAPEASALNIASGESARQVASVTEKCNVKAGYTVTLSSANAPTGNALVLKDSDTGNTDNVPYSLTYGSSAVTLANGSATITDASGVTGGAGAQKALKVTIVAAPNITAATYADTLTFTIASK